jgi:homoserine acetyltransferase
MMNIKSQTTVGFWDRLMDCKRPLNLLLVVILKVRANGGCRQSSSANRVKRLVVL